MEKKGWKPNVEVSQPCPRCGSSNTKFCYYNNYSLTQPRYFCKGCRRYWTKGGSLRNVPIGGGCRKSKRGKSLRVSTDGGVASRNSDHNEMKSSSLFSGPDASNSTIDLAALYANFLNQKSEPQTQIDEILVPSFEFPNFHSLHTSRGNSYLSQETVRFPDCGAFSANLSETQSGNENHVMYFYGIDSVQKQQQFTIGTQFTSIDRIDNFPLPTLPVEDVTSEGIMLAGSDIPIQILHSTHQMPEVIKTGGQDSEPSNGDGSPFNVLNLETIIRP